MSQPIKVRITLEVVGTTDRPGWEWGEGLAKFLQGELTDQDADSFGPITVDCLDVETIKEPSRG